MKTAMHTDRLEWRFGAVRAVRLLCEAGFEAIDYSMYNSELPVFMRGGRIIADELKRIAEGYGAKINQTHAPFSDFLLGEENFEHNRTVYASICEAIRISSYLGAKTVVVHPAEICPLLSSDERFFMNMELYSHLVCVAREAGVNIAIENLYSRHSQDENRIIGGVCSGAAELIRYADALGGEGVSVCFDVGHAELVGESSYSMIRALGERIKHIHIHDTDLLGDIHTLPYLAKVDFLPVCKALGKNGYDGDVTLEADGFLRNMPDALIPSALLFARSVASYLRDEIIKYYPK